VKICCEVVGASKGSIMRKWEPILDYLLYYYIIILINLYLYLYLIVAREEAVTRVFLYKFLK
jgi:hypothetical protein